MTKQQSNIQQIGLIIALLLTGALIFFSLTAFIPSFLGALTLFIVLKKPYFALLKKKLKPASAAIILILLFSLAAALLLVGFSTMLSGKLADIVHGSSDYFDGLKELNTYIKNTFYIDLLSDDNLASIKNILAKSVSSILNSTFSVISIIGIMLMLLYFMLINYQKIEQYLYEYLPFKDENVKAIVAEVKNSVWSNTIIIPLIALIQGVLAFVGYFIFGVDSPFFWAVVTAFMALLPFIGTAIVWLPISVFLFANAHQGQGIGLALYSLIVITSSDNVLRVLLQKQFSDENPMVTILGVIIGLPLFGFIGLIFGPLLISIFLLFLKIYIKEYFPKFRTYDANTDEIF